MDHQTQVDSLQEQIRNYRGSAYIALKRHSGHSNTTRSKSYHQSSYFIQSRPLDKLIHIDQEHRTVRVESQMTMEALVSALIPYGLLPPIVPEFKGITVGGAIMGAAAESFSHKYGIFSDICTRFELISGKGELIIATPTQNKELFYAIPGSYGSLGLLVSADVKLLDMKQNVHVKATHFTKLDNLIDQLRKPSRTDFLDAIVFSETDGVLIEGQLTDERYSIKDNLYSPWFYQSMEQEASFIMSLYDYLFRFDRGAFWMGAYLLKPSLLAKFLSQGLYKIIPDHPLSDKERRQFYKISSSSLWQRVISHQWMPSQKLWKLLHKAENWVQNRFIIQDFCIPDMHALDFLHTAISDTGIFPLWLCPIKGTRESQIFAPHLLPTNVKESQFINIGMYGMPSKNTTTEILTKTLEQKTRTYLGRKVLYSRSYYSEAEFWEIYSQSSYENLRSQTSSHGRWPEITTKVLNP